MKFALIAAAAVSSSVLLAPTFSHARAVAEVEVDQVSATVDAKGLDLRSDAGRKIFERRLASEIRRMCSEPGRRDLAAQMDVRECIASARAG